MGTKGGNLGEFEEIILLLVGTLKDEAYGLAICEAFNKQSNRTTAIGAVHATLGRLQDKGYVESKMGGATKERGGRRKRFFNITALGKKALIQNRDLRVSLWNQIPDLKLQNI